MTRKLFITGTDTEVGKTTIAAGLLKVFNQQGYSTLGVKPVASDCTLIDGLYRNADALSLQQAASIKLPYDVINPFAFVPPIAPHIAALDVGITLSVAQLSSRCQQALTYPADIIIIEGAGGWLVPLNQQETLADFAKSHGFEVILVVGLRLGCINHTLLTCQAIRAAGLKLAGWVANCVSANMDKQSENIVTLRQWVDAPCLGVVPFKGQPERYLSMPDNSNFQQKTANILEK